MNFDLIGSLLSLLATYYFIRANALAWAVSIGATLINSFLFFQKGIYADMVLESFYFFSSLYGLYCWKAQKSRVGLIEKIKKPTTSHYFWILVTVCFGYILIAHFLKTYTNSSIADLDALTTVLSIIAQILMCYKIITTWVIWLITDLIYTSVYYQKSLPFHTGLMIIYSFMALLGYLHWARQELIPTKEIQSAIAKI